MSVKKASYLNVQLWLATFIDFCNALWRKWFHARNLNRSHLATWPPIDERFLFTDTGDHLHSRKLTAAQWPLDDNSECSHVKIVEVEFFPMNYTTDGEDPNLRITHYSNRLH